MTPALKHYGSICQTDRRAIIPQPDPQRGDGRGIDLAVHYDEIRRYLRVRFRQEVVGLDLDAQELEDRVVLGILRANRGAHPYDPVRRNGAGKQTSLQGYTYLKARTAISHMLRERGQARALTVLLPLYDPEVEERLEETAAPAELLTGREARELLDGLAVEARERALEAAREACPLFPLMALGDDPTLRAIEEGRALTAILPIPPPATGAALLDDGPRRAAPAPASAPTPHATSRAGVRARPTPSKKVENEVSTPAAVGVVTSQSPTWRGGSSAAAVVVIRRPRRAA